MYSYLNIYIITWTYASWILTRTEALSREHVHSYLSMCILTWTFAFLPEPNHCPLSHKSICIVTWHVHSLLNICILIRTDAFSHGQMHSYVNRCILFCYVFIGLFLLWSCYLNTINLLLLPLGLRLLFTECAIMIPPPSALWISDVSNTIKGIVDRGLVKNYKC